MSTPLPQEQAARQSSDFEALLKLARDSHHARTQAEALYTIGNLYYQVSQNDKALAAYDEALPIFRSLGDRTGEAKTLNNIGLMYHTWGERQKALEYYNQALTISRAVASLQEEASTLTNIGAIYSSIGETEKALEYFNQALPIRRSVGDRSGEAITLNNIGALYKAVGDPQKALACYNQALLIQRALGDRAGVAVMLNNIGDVHQMLGEHQKALEYYNEAMPVLHAMGDRRGEAQILTNIGVAYSELGEPEKGLEFYNEALPITRSVGNRAGEAMTLNNIGAVYLKLHEPQKALDYYNQALLADRSIGNRAGEAYELIGIGRVYNDLGESQKAVQTYNLALPLAAAVNDPVSKATVLYALSMFHEVQQPALAIFYGKQAVNLLQQVRSNMQGLDKELQKSFVTSNSHYYRNLAKLLIDEGRLAEAQEVLDLLKQREYTDYVRGNPAKILSPLSLTPTEQQAEEEYQKSTKQLVAQNERWNELKKNKARTPEEDKEFQRLSDQLEQAGKGFDGYYSRLYKLFGRGTAANHEAADVKGNVSVLNHLIANMPHLVALYTTVTEKRYNVIVISGSTMVGRVYTISEKDLNQKIAAFQQVLRDPSKDPRPLAQELYNILIGPVKADLDQAQAQTLVWSLDGTLRYIPMAALYDGQRYLVEKYNNVTFTHASIPFLSEKPDVAHVSAAAMGISRKYEDDLDPLPRVASELHDIVKDPQTADAKGVMPGSILLNGQFTEKAMESQLDSHHPIVHIASHFVFKPGDDNASYLLLAGKETEGKGYHLTVADFNANRNLGLDNTDLLTLSACETGMSGNASNGEEIDGLGAVAQNKGAKAVISSLWEVNDASTADLMADFYRRWANGAGNVTKVEALRLAQIDLLEGRIKPAADNPDPNAAATFAHPYYWAPFVLMGNWR